MSNEMISVPRNKLKALIAQCLDEAGGNPDLILEELRALLAKSVDPKPTGLSQGWNLTRKHDGFVVGHQSVAYPPDESAIQRAEREGYVWVPFLVSTKQHQGEPVAS